MKKNELIENFLEYKKLNNSSKHSEIRPQTLKQYRMITGYFLDYIKKKPEDLTEEEFNKFLLMQKSPATQNNYATIIKQFYRWIYREDQSQMPFFIRDYKNHKIEINEIEYQKKLVSDSEFEKLIEFSSNPLQRAVIECLKICGARRGRALQLKVEDVKFEDGNTVITVEKSKTIPRNIYAPGRYEHLLKWKETLCHNRNNPKGLLFTSIRNGQIKPVNLNYAYDTLKTICRRAGIRQIRPHDFRHTCITDWCKEYKEQLVKRQAGLSKNSRMLQVYAHNTDDDVKEAINKNHKSDKVSYELLEKQYKQERDDNQKEIADLKGQLAKVNQTLHEFSVAFGRGVSPHSKIFENKTP